MDLGSASGLEAVRDPKLLITSGMLLEFEIAVAFEAKIAFSAELSRGVFLQDR